MELRPPMQDWGIARRTNGVAVRCAGLVGSFLAVAALTACSSMGGDTFTVFADPGKYQYYTCAQIAEQRKNWVSRGQELKMLMNKAEQGAGGSMVSLIAYKGDYVAANEEVKILENTARVKNCDRPENWKSNSSVQ